MTLEQLRYVIAVWDMDLHIIYVEYAETKKLWNQKMADAQLQRDIMNTARFIEESHGISQRNTLNILLKLIADEEYERAHQ